MYTILDECPGDGFLLFVQFDRGNATKETRQEIIKEQKYSIMVNDAPWCYTRGSGVLCINPAKFGNDPESIANIMWKPNRFLEGATISEWWYEKA